MVTGAVALAEFAHVVAEKYPVNIALHTDHCPKDKLDAYVRPLIALSKDRVDAGQAPLFQSHMWDGSAVDLDENLSIAEELIAKCASAQICGELAALAWLDEGDGASRAADAPGPADAVHVDVGRGRDVEVDDVGHGDDVEPARGDVRGHEDGDAPALEGDHHAVARALAHVA